MFIASAESLFLKQYKTASVLRILCSWASTGSQKTFIMEPRPFPSWPQTCSKMISYWLPGGIFNVGPRNAPKMVSWRLPGSIFRAGPRNALNWGRPEGFLEASWKPPGHIFRAGRRNAPKLCPGSFLEAFSTLGSEML